jgi:hypothetical protein
MDPSLTASLNI